MSLCQEILLDLKEIVKEANKIARIWRSLSLSAFVDGSVFTICLFGVNDGPVRAVTGTQEGRVHKSFRNWVFANCQLSTDKAARKAIWQTCSINLLYSRINDIMQDSLHS
jgi:hypothetical protein